MGCNEIETRLPGFARRGARSLNDAIIGRSPISERFIACSSGSRHGKQAQTQHQRDQPKQPLA
ncbi:hypothetical protein [Lysobacter gummosus]|uniref:hypothetical protein n=1 Tax=Lysobacter gummosus TaxID=262324 RepID=UPI003627CA15